LDKVSEYPGEVSILALGPLTNLALVSILSSSFPPLPLQMVIP
jgi:inosine-uridine nucleoside N-ribohydrolase